VHSDALHGFGAHANELQKERWRTGMDNSLLPHLALVVLCCTVLGFG